MSEKESDGTPSFEERLKQVQESVQAAPTTAKNFIPKLYAPV